MIFFFSNSSNFSGYAFNLLMSFHRSLSFHILYQQIRCLSFVLSYRRAPGLSRYCGDNNILWVTKLCLWDGTVQTINCYSTLQTGYAVRASSLLARDIRFCICTCQSILMEYLQVLLSSAWCVNLTTTILVGTADLGL